MSHKIRTEIKPSGEVVYIAEVTTGSGYLLVGMGPTKETAISQAMRVYGEILSGLIDPVLPY